MVCRLSLHEMGLLGGEEGEIMPGQEPEGNVLAALCSFLFRD
jgi:hypothetical protein